MFTGIIEERGRIQSVRPRGGDAARLTIEATHVLDDVELGASIAVNGCCLTVVDHGPGWWAADAVPETIERTALSRLAVGDTVNLERPMRADGRFGGHFVQGHVDATTTLVDRSPEPDGSERLRFTLPGEAAPFVCEKGSIAVDGISLTVAAVDTETFTVAVIPHTLNVTTLGTLRPGQPVNLELDVIAKYVERQSPSPDTTTPEPVRCDPIEDAIAAIAAGEFVVVVDDENRENEGDLIIAADAITPEQMTFLVRHSSGVVCCAITGDRADALALPPMVAANADAMGTAFTITVDAVAGTTTGISAADRSATCRALAAPDSSASDLNRPGHVFPLRARDGGVMARPGHTEAAVDLARLAGRSPAGVLCEIVDDDGSMARLPRLRAFADQHGLALVTIADLADHLHRSGADRVERRASARIPTPHGAFTAHTYRDRVTGVDHVAYVIGDPTESTALVRVHSECLTGDVLGSIRCDCGSQLREALAAIGHNGHGVLLYLRDHEGRGIGLDNKLRAYELQDAGMDTVDANLALGLPVDARDYRSAAAILRHLGARSVRLLTNNPAKTSGLRGAGIDVATEVPLAGQTTTDNAAYLATKRDRMGHALTHASLPTLESA